MWKVKYQWLKPLPWEKHAPLIRLLYYKPLISALRKVKCENTGAVGPSLVADIKDLLVHWLRLSPQSHLYCLRPCLLAGTHLLPCLLWHNAMWHNVKVLWLGYFMYISECSKYYTTALAVLLNSELWITLPAHTHRRQIAAEHWQHLAA